MKFSLYDNEALDETIEMATKNQSKEEWMAKCHKNIAALVNAKPAEYRTFGIYWWPIKQMLVSDRLMAGTVDIEQVEICTTGDGFRDMAGALMFHEHCSNNFINSNKVIVSDDEDGSEEYLLMDDELEALIFIGETG
jgi:hypothetical protein